MHSISFSKPIPVSSRFARNCAVDQPDGREILDPGEPERLELAEEDVGNQERIGRTDPGQDRGLLDGRQHLERHLLDDRLALPYGMSPASEPRPAMRNRPEL